MTYTAKVAICYEIRTKHSTRREHPVECLMLRLAVRQETTRLEKVKHYAINAYNCMCLDFRLVVLFVCATGNFAKWRMVSN
jgi:hypothetical protein